ncbi:MAG: hypothetical protein AAF218_10505 [Pseudomonadota bacterium]
MPEIKRRRSYRFIRKEVNRRAQGNPIPDMTEAPLLRAALSYVHWFGLCLSHAPEVIFRVDRPADDALLSAFVDRPVKRHDEIKRNLKADHVKPVLTEADFEALPDDVLKGLADMAGRLGYPEDAEWFDGLVRTAAYS